jgi:hypothetical protein
VKIPVPADHDALALSASLSQHLAEDNGESSKPDAVRWITGALNYSVYESTAPQWVCNCLLQVCCNGVELSQELSGHNKDRYESRYRISAQFSKMRNPENQEKIQPKQLRYKFPAIPSASHPLLPA